MTKVQLILDGVMCMLWITTYILALISTKKYKYPALPPIAQAVIFPLEFAVAIKYISNFSLNIGYAGYAYICWAAIQIAIVAVIIKMKLIDKRSKIVFYFSAMFCITILMIYLVTYKEYVLFFAHFNTFVGNIFWFVYMLKKNYPMNRINLMMFVTKFVADAMVIPVYFNSGTWVINVMCIGTPIIDFLFVVFYLIKWKKGLYIPAAAEPEVPTLKAKAGSSEATLSWNKTDGATGYEVYMATSENGIYNKVSTIQKAATVKYVKKNLAKGQTYYFKIRNYKTVGGKNVYSAYSNIKNAKIK